MILLKRFLISIFVFLIIFFLAFWGFKRNFPGNSIAVFLQKYLTKETGIPFEIKDLELGWKKLSTKEISILTPRWIPFKKQSSLLTIKEVELPFLSIFSSGKIILFGKIHGGKIKVDSNIFSQKNLNILVERLKIEQVPLIELAPFLISGELTFLAKISNLNDFKNQISIFPEVHLQGKIKDSKISFSGRPTFFNFQFPEFEFPEITFDIESGNLISINNIHLNGSMEGTVNGSINLNKNRPSMSSLNINFKLLPSPIIKDQLSSVSSIISQFQCGDLININVTGSITRINFPTRNEC